MLLLLLLLLLAVAVVGQPPLVVSECGDCPAELQEVCGDTVRPCAHLRWPQ